MQSFENWMQGQVESKYDFDDSDFDLRYLPNLHEIDDAFEKN